MWKATKKVAASFGHGLLVGAQNGFRLYFDVTGLIHEADDAVMLERYRELVATCEPGSSYPHDLREALVSRLRSLEAAAAEAAVTVRGSAYGGKSDFAARIETGIADARLVKIEKLKLLLNGSNPPPERRRSEPRVVRTAQVRRSSRHIT